MHKHNTNTQQHKQFYWMLSVILNIPSMISGITHHFSRRLSMDGFTGVPGGAKKFWTD